MARRRDPVTERHKLSPSAISTFLKSPKSFYYRYKVGIEPIQQSVTTFDEAKLCGQLWSEFVDYFYRGTSEEENTTRMLTAWQEQTQGWVPEKAKDRLTKAMESWAASYYQMFRPDDGVRIASEVKVENDRFQGYLDGISADKVIHEVKSTSRSPQLDGQLWKIQRSIQVKLYSVLAEATGICIEIAFKDPPYAIYRSQVLDVTKAERDTWEAELNGLADYIYSLGDDPNNYPCNPDSCCLVTRGVTSMCSYFPLCSDGLTDENRIAYKDRQTNRK